MEVESTSVPCLLRAVGFQRVCILRAGSAQAASPRDKSYRKPKERYPYRHPGLDRSQLALLALRKSKSLNSGRDGSPSRPTFGVRCLDACRLRAAPKTFGAER